MAESLVKVSSTKGVIFAVMGIETSAKLVEISVIAADYLALMKI